MKKIKLKKRVIVPLVTVALASAVAPAAYAGSGTYSSSKYFSPNSVYWQPGNDTFGDVVRVKMSGKFSDSRINSIQSNWGLYKKAPGMNFQDAYYDQGKPYLDGTSYLSTNYPTPKYDWEDDNGDSRDEEVEVVSTRPDLMNTSTTYYFKADYAHKVQSGISKILGTTHSSAQSYTGEWNTAEFENVK